MEEVKRGIESVINREMQWSPTEEFTLLVFLILKIGIDRFFDERLVFSKRALKACAVNLVLIASFMLELAAIRRILKFLELLTG